MRLARVSTTVLALCYLAMVAACMSTRPANYGQKASHFGDLLITADQIADQRAPNAWEILRQLVPRYTYVEDRAGRALGITGRRGKSSISLTNSEAPLVIVDGARLSALDVLQQMPRDAIDRIELLNGARGTSAEGTNASAGVIYIHTRFGS